MGVAVERACVTRPIPDGRVVRDVKPIAVVEVNGTHIGDLATNVVDVVVVGLVSSYKIVVHLLQRQEIEEEDRRGA
jgi:hypothetical protein